MSLLLVYVYAYILLYFSYISIVESCHCWTRWLEPSGRTAVHISIGFVICHRPYLVTILAGNHPKELRPILSKSFCCWHPVCAAVTCLPSCSGSKRQCSSYWSCHQSRARPIIDKSTTLMDWKIRTDAPVIASSSVL